MDEKFYKDKKVILIAGPKGGVGKTTIALNSSIALSHMNRRVLLIDADFSISSFSLLYGQEYHLRYDRSYTSNELLEKITLKGPNGVDIIPSPYFDFMQKEIEQEYTQKLLEAVELTKKYDFIIIDLSPGFNDSHLSFIESSDMMIIVTTPDPSSISASYSLMKISTSEIPKAKVGILINQADSVDEGKEVFTKFSTAVSFFLEKTISHLGDIPEDDNVVRSSKDETPLILRFPETIASLAINQLACKLVG